MNLIASKKSWLLAPVLFALSVGILFIVWAVMEPAALQLAFDNNGVSPVELMTLPLFALIIPLVWLCPPVSGSVGRKCFWASIYSLLGFMALVRQQDWHKALMSELYPQIVSNFRGTVFKMRFLTADDIPLMPKLVVVLFFVLFFVAVVLPLARYALALFKEFFKFNPVAWTMAVFGASSVMVLVLDRLPANLRHMGVAVSDSSLALMKALEEGGEMMMALFALLAILQAFLIYGWKSEENRA